MDVQVFGTRKNADTRKALRFFSERRVKAHFIDLTQRGASRRELMRFAQKVGVPALIDRGSRRFADLGLAHAALSEERWIEKLIDEPLLLTQPLVRRGNDLTVGLDEATWKAWVGR